MNKKSPLLFSIMMKINPKDISVRLHILILRFRENGIRITEFFLFLISLTSGFILIRRIGYNLEQDAKENMHQLCDILLLLFFIASSFRVLLNYKIIKQEKLFIIDIGLNTFTILVLFFNVFVPLQMREQISLPAFLQSYTLVYVLLAILSIVNISRYTFSLMGRKTNPSLLFIYSFLFLILLGTGLLLLPNSTFEGISFTDALFTSTTSVCVTGLTSVDIATAFTHTGKIIILFLVQIGGIGVMTFTSFFAISFMGNSSFGKNFLLKDFLNEDNLGNIFKTLVNIITVTFIVEIIGALLIFDAIHQKTGTSAGQEVFAAIFHSVSAFCNAGLSTFHGNLINPMIDTNYNLQFWVAILIIIGGLGFPIIFNYFNLIKHLIVNFFNITFKRQEGYIHQPRIINIHTRIVVVTTIILLVSGTVFIYIAEYNNSLEGMSFKGKIVSAFLGAVTPRTAGFNNLNPEALLPSTVIFIMMLMVIGAGSMSTGGGIKVSTFAVTVLSALGIIRGKQRLEISGREIDPHIINKSYATLLLYFAWVFIAVSILSFSEQKGNFTQWFFEVISALSTVGLSLNFTPELSITGKYVIIITMFCGRIGILMFLSGFVKRHQPKNYRYPQATIIL